MTTPLKIPEVGESVKEVQIGRWLKKAGEQVAEDENVVELETDKASLELASPVSGVLSEQLKREGDTVSVGDVIGYVQEGATSGQPKAAEQTAEQPSANDRATKPIDGKSSGTASDSGNKKSSDHKSSERPKDSREQIPVTPAARRALRQHGLSADDVSASGKRLRARDVAEHLRRQEESQPPRELPPEREREITTSSPSDRSNVHHGGELEEVVRMSLIRRRIAERLVEAQQKAALLTTFNEIDMSAVMHLRQEYKERFQQRHGVKLGFMPFFIKAVIEALKQVPALNAEIRGEDIVFRHYHDIGVAIGSGKGLVVPVLRNADRMSFADIEKGIEDYAKRAVANKIRPEELQGGTFTISNGGIYGSLLSTPIVNPPQSGVLGMHTIQERPVARAGQVVIRPMMYVALTYDHRLVDGREAVTFLVRIKETIEEPSRLLIEV